MDYNELDRKVRAAQEELQAGARDAQADGVDTDSCWNEIVEAGCWDLETVVARELCRRELGYIPHALEPRLGRADWLNS